MTDETRHRPHAAAVRRHPATTAAGPSATAGPRDEDFALYEDAIRYFGQGNLAAATQALEEHVTRHPAHASAYSLLGNLHRMGGRFRDAETAWQRYLALKPANRHGLLEIGRCRLAAGDQPGATGMFEQYLADEGETPESLYEVGMAYHQNSDHGAAATYYERALGLKPEFHLARQQLAVTCHSRGELKLAEKLFRDVVRAQTGNFEVYRHLGAIHRDHGDLTTAMADFRHAMQLERRALRLDEERDEGFGLVPRRTGLLNLEIYAEQIEHLLAVHKLHAGFERELEHYRSVISELRQQGDSRSVVELSENQRRRLGRSFGRVLHLGPLSAIPAGALNHRLDFAAIRQQLETDPNSGIIVDDFLTGEAAETLAAYCHESTIWFRPARNGMVRARLEDGFGTGLMLQLVEELRTRFPLVLGLYRLTGLEGRMYASRAYDLRPDDEPGVLLIVWLSADNANLEPNRGGLMLQARRSTDSGEYQSLIESGATASVSDEDAPRPIAHRHNRAVLINESLSARPDDCQFRPGLASRRLEMVLRFTRRDSA